MEAHLPRGLEPSLEIQLLGWGVVGVNGQLQRLGMGVLLSDPVQEQLQRPLAQALALEPLIDEEVEHPVVVRALRLIASSANPIIVPSHEKAYGTHTMPAGRT